MRHEDFIMRKDLHERMIESDLYANPFNVSSLFWHLETRTSFKHQESLHCNRRVIGVSSVKRTRTVVQMHANEQLAKE
jgi:hypothetical protein